MWWVCKPKRKPGIAIGSSRCLVISPMTKIIGVIRRQRTHPKAKSIRAFASKPPKPSTNYLVCLVLGGSPLGRQCGDSTCFVPQPGLRLVPPAGEVTSPISSLVALRMSSLQTYTLKLYLGLQTLHHNEPNHHYHVCYMPSIHSPLLTQETGVTTLSHQLSTKY